MKNIFSLLFLAIILMPAMARRTVVSTASAVNSGSWSAGDTVVLKNGNWTNQSISLRAFGTASQPVVLEAENPGLVIFNGSSKIAFSGQYVEVSGLYFKDGTLSGSPVVEFRTSSSNTAENCRLTNCVIMNYNPALNTVDSKWVSLYGRNNRVDHCSFENKNNSGTLLVVWLSGGIIPAHIIENNFFGYRNANLDSEGNELNGQEIIRIGDSSTSMQYASCVVRGNYFERCNGEIEIISNKSCGNLYSNNVFFECKGMLTLRHGNDCTVEGNYFFGNKVSSSGGVRIIGEAHKVYNNYFQDLTGNNFRAALCMVRGKENSVLNDYFQVKNAVVVFNTFVNCYEAFCINYNSSSTYTMPPVGTVVAHNHVYNTNINNTNVNLALQNVNLDVTWKNNLMNVGKYNYFSYNSTQIITGQNPLMQLVANPVSMYEPLAGSALSNFTTAEYEFIISDISGKARILTTKLPGASEIVGVSSRVIPQKKSTGAFFYNNVTSIGSTAENSESPLKLSCHNGLLSVEAIRSGKLSVFDAAGNQIRKMYLLSGIGMEKYIGKGFFLISFACENGQVYSSKIII